ncbi:MAG: molybdopterin molybdenumtransferase MoeA, partial [Rhodospirillales bacterium]
GFVLGFHKIAMKPGKPLMFGQWGRIPVLGLPGNPVSAMVGAHLFLKPMLRRLLGVEPALPLPITAELAAPLPQGGPRQEYLRAGFERLNDGRFKVHPFASQDSALIADMARADALIVRPPNAPAAKPKEGVDILLLD